MIYLGADHRGFELKNRLFKRLQDEGYEVSNLGNDHFDPNDDYVDFAEKVAQAVAGDSENKGILLCGSGNGVDMVANKIPGIRSALTFDVTRAIQAREDEDANVAALPSDTLDEESAWEIVKAFLTTSFSEEERHQRRLQKMEEVESNES
jgi:ribose 5-phosphate isomerase B